MGGPGSGRRKGGISKAQKRYLGSSLHAKRMESIGKGAALKKQRDYLNSSLHKKRMSK